jgi:hypothetical protein
LPPGFEREAAGSNRVHDIGPHFEHCHVVVAREPETEYRTECPGADDADPHTH